MVRMLLSLNRKHVVSLKTRSPLKVPSLSANMTEINFRYEQRCADNNKLLLTNRGRAVGSVDNAKMSFFSFASNRLTFFWVRGGAEPETRKG